MMRHSALIEHTHPLVRNRSHSQPKDADSRIQFDCAGARALAFPNNRGPCCARAKGRKQPFASDGTVKAHYDVEPLHHINSIFDRMRQGVIQGRIVMSVA